MAIRNIVQIGDEVLRKKSIEVTVFDEKLHQLLDDMKETLKKAEGAGLACVQVGVLKRIFIVDLEEEGYVEFINPVILQQKGGAFGNEGCLSIKGKWGKVMRPTKVKIKAQDRFGKEFTITAKNFFARAICHEFDHLEGIVYTDRATELYEERK